MKTKKFSLRIANGIFCLLLLLSTLPLTQFVFATPSDLTDRAVDFDWINAANSCISNYTAIAADPNNENWPQYLTDKFYEQVKFTPTNNAGYLKWNDNIPTGTIKWNNSDSSANLPSISGTVIDVASPQEFIAVARWLNGEYTTSPGKKNNYTISILNDFDMGGLDGYIWPDNVTLPSYTTVNGNGHTVYNLKMLSLPNAQGKFVSQRCGFISYATTIKMFDLNFDSAHVMGGYQVAVALGGMTPGSVDETQWNELRNIHISNSIAISRNSGGQKITEGGTGTLMGRYQNENTYGRGGDIINCSSVGCMVVGMNHQGALTTAILNSGVISRCFATDAIVISYGQHSGGLFSCIGGSDEVSQCFVDAQVYGSESTGVFCGTAANIKFYDCFSSGFVEGLKILGGFAGKIELGKNCTFVNCYSTALVGIRSSDSTEKLGGFIGYVESNAGYNAGFVNCYAAGEVGSAAVDSTLEGTSRPDTVGGFIGSEYNTRHAMGTSTVSRVASCYYDMQTTAMREWDVGSDKGQNSLAKTAANPTVLNGFIPTGTLGIRGLLTTNTQKLGTGLTDNPGSSGFTGFLDMSSYYLKDDSAVAFGDARYKTKASNPYTGWDYSARNHYPELACFSGATLRSWCESVIDPADLTVCETALTIPEENRTQEQKQILAKYDRQIKQLELVKDYSKSSTSTVMLETWEKSLNKENGELVNDTESVKTYDTVRDLTIRFTLTGDVQNYQWYRTELVTQKITDQDTPNSKGAMVTLYDGASPVSVMTLATKTVDSYEYYYADQFSPGLEWLLVKYGKSERRLRVMPTVGIEAGKSKTVYRPSDDSPYEKKIIAFYDHADDVELYYSTAKRMAQSITNITTGIFPDAAGATDSHGNIIYGEKYLSRSANALSANQKNLMADSNDSDISDYFVMHGDNTYGIGVDIGNNHVTPGVDATFMSRTKKEPITGASTFPQTNVDYDNSANGSKLYVYWHEVKSIDTTTGEIETTENILNYTKTEYVDVLNGLSLATHDDQMIMMEYIWELNDGRIITDAKLITIRATPFNTLITAYDAGGLDNSVPDNNKLLLDSANGLLDSDDMTVNMKRFSGTKAETDISEEDLLTENLTQDELFPYTEYPDIFDSEGNHLPVPQNLIGPQYNDALIASWVVNNDEKVVTKIRLVMDSGRNNSDEKQVFFTAEINPALTDTLTIDYEYYRYITEDNGNFFVHPEILPRNYTVKSRTIGGKTVYYLLFNYDNAGDNAVESEFGTVDEVDVANHIMVSLELSAKVEVEKVVTGDYSDANDQFDFNFKINDNNASDIKYDYQIERPDPNDASQRIVIKDTRTDLSLAKLIADGNTVQTISLKHKDCLKIIGLPYGSTYELSETDYKERLYTTTSELSVKALDGSVTKIIRIPDGETKIENLAVTALDAIDPIISADRAYVFYNDKSIPPPTGISTDIQWPWMLIIIVIIAIAAIIVVSCSRKRRFSKHSF